MKKIIEDIYNENFTTKEMVLFGIIAPLAFVLIVGFLGGIL